MTSYDQLKLDYPEHYDDEWVDTSDHPDDCECQPCMREYRQAQSDMRREDPY